MPATWGQGLVLKGTRGSLFSITNGLPTDANATNLPGDFALDSTTQLLYTRGASGWPTSGGVLLRGAMGVTGVSGASFYSGPGAPTASSPANPNNGDLFLDLANGEIYKFVNGSWTDQGYSIQGPQGIQGPPGVAGAATRGSQIFSGSGAPSSNLASFSNGSVTGAVSGDLYLDTTTAPAPTLYILGQ